MGLRRSAVVHRPLPTVADRFGIRSMRQVARDLGEVLRDGLTGKRFQFDVRSVGLLRPRLSLPAYAGLRPDDGLAPVFNLFDRHGGGHRYTQRVSRATARDFRGGRLSYDEHDGIDLVCPIGTPLCAAAPGTVVLIRDRWLRGGLSVSVDHGHGVVTQYTHCAAALVPVGTVVERGQPVALSGAAGYDLVQFFPFIPPHIHFTVYVDGRPADPYLASDEPARPGVWKVRNDPAPAARLPGDPEAPDPSPVDASAASRVAEACLDRTIAEEIEARRRDPAQLAALLDDALLHDRWAWPDDLAISSVRTTAAPPRTVQLTLPLPAGEYRGARFCDTALTRPR